MELAGIVALKILGMILILAVGVLCQRLQIISDRTNKQLAELVMLVVNPILILMSYNTVFERALLKNFIWALIASAAVFALTILIAHVTYPDRRSAHARVERFALVYTNCSFIGIPLIQGVIGAEGILLMSAFIGVFNILVWTHGVVVMSGIKPSLKQFLGSLKAPALIAVVVGFLMFISPFRLPAWLAEPLDLIGGMNTPLAMLVAGVNLAQGDLLRVVRQKRTHIFNAVKLFLIPALTIGLMWLFVHLAGVDYKVAMTVFVAAACPTGSSVTMFAGRYDEDEYYAADLFMISTLFSLITIPLMAMLAALAFV